MRSRWSTLICCTAALLGATSGAPAQQALERVDPNIDDINPLSTSLRDLEEGLQLPNAFKQVYRVPGRSGEFMRIDGALHAVFPQSIYKQTQQGEIPVVPPGTVFYIGPPPDPFVGSVALPDDPHRVSGWLTPEYHRFDPTDVDENGTPTSAMTQSQSILTNPVVHMRVEELDRLPRVVADDHYRRARLHELMQRAASAKPSSSKSVSG